MLPRVRPSGTWPTTEPNVRGVLPIREACLRLSSRGSVPRPDRGCDWAARRGKNKRRGRHTRIHPGGVSRSTEFVR